MGAIVNGRIRNLAEFGAFVELEEGMEGLIHISDVSWTERIKHPSEKFKKGEAVEAKVLKVDSQNRRLSLGIKQVNDIWANWFKDAQDRRRPQGESGAHHGFRRVRGAGRRHRGAVPRLGNRGAAAQGRPRKGERLRETRA